MKTPTSIYRQHAGLVYAIADPVNRIKRDEPAGPEGSLELMRQRRAPPLAFLLPDTREWLDTLPRKAQPYALCTLYPRIANLIAVKWADMKALSAYLDELLVDRRRGRRGFPPEVLNDLCVLREYHAAFHRHATGSRDCDFRKK